MQTIYQRMIKLLGDEKATDVIWIINLNPYDLLTEEGVETVNNSPSLTRFQSTHRTAMTSKTQPFSICHERLIALKFPQKSASVRL